MTIILKIRSRKGARQKRERVESRQGKEKSHLERVQEAAASWRKKVCRTLPKKECGVLRKEEGDSTR